MWAKGKEVPLALQNPIESKMASILQRQNRLSLGGKIRDSFGTFEAVFPDLDLPQLHLGHFVVVGSGTTHGAWSSS
jgi:hypothetical protein